MPKPKRYIFWIRPDEDRGFQLKDLIDHLQKAALDPENTNVHIDVDQEEDGFVSGIKLHCEERVSMFKIGDKVETEEGEDHVVGEVKDLRDATPRNPYCVQVAWGLAGGDSTIMWEHPDDLTHAKKD